MPPHPQKKLRRVLLCCYYLPRISQEVLGQDRNGTSSWLQQRFLWPRWVGETTETGMPDTAARWTGLLPCVGWRDISNSSIILRVVLVSAPTRLPKRVRRAEQGPHNRGTMINPRSSCW
jgi:hypothetical protein